MRLADLAPEVLAEIRRYRYDRILEKHEGPERWDWALKYAEFLAIAGRDVLLPIERDNHPNVTVLRVIVSDDGAVLTVFLRDTTYGHDWFDSGYLAVCERFPGQQFFLATVYHEWFIFQNPLD